MPEGNNDFKTPFETEYLRRECRLMRWLLALVPVAIMIVFAVVVCYQANLNAELADKALKAMQKGRPAITAVQ